jgi:hypothetical protein
MTEQAITTLQAAKDARMTDVLILLFTDPSMKIIDACWAADVDYNSFRYWSRVHPDFISDMRNLLGEYQREQILDLNLAWSVGLNKLNDALMSGDTNTELRMELHKYITTIRDTFLKAYHAEPGLEEAAQEFLSRGPAVQVQQSRFASMEISQTAEGLHVDVYQPVKVIEAEAKEIAPQTNNSHPPENQ